VSIRKVLSTLGVASLMAGGALSASAAPTGIGGQHQTTFTPGRYIVTLADPAVATYRGGVNGYAATKPDAGKQLNARATAAQTYSQYLVTRQKDVANAAAVKIDQSYTLAPDELKHVTATPSTSFLGLDGTGGVWDKIGGLDKAGNGIVLGDLDTGIAPENPSFAGSTSPTKRYVVIV